MRTPLADGNLAVFADRWKLIETDTLPDYLAFVHDHPDEARALVETPVSVRAARYRVLRRIPALAAALARWRMSVRLAAHQPPTRAAAAGPTVIDLTRPLSAAPVWMRPDRTPIDLTVVLPSDRTFRAQAVFATRRQGTSTAPMCSPPKTSAESTSSSRSPITCAIATA